MAKHDCTAQGAAGAGGRGPYIWLCSRCGGCYVCKHKAVWFDQQEKWMWKCKDGKFREVILDGRAK